MANDKGDSKEGILASDQLNLKVLGQDGQVVQFKIKKNTPLRKLMSAYCDRCKLAQNTIRFMFDGTRIDEGDTPKSMDMEDGDTIEVFTQQSGGSSPPSQQNSYSTKHQTSSHTRSRFRHCWSRNSSVRTIS